MQVLVEVERSGFVESRHVGAVVVADADGAVQAAVGEPSMPIYLRSCAKPMQALAVWSLGVDRELGLDAVALAGAAGSHAGEPEHIASVRKVLAAAGLQEHALRCPPARPLNADARRAVDGPAPIYHNCSAKHAYMLAGAVARGWDPERYTSREHPVQAMVSDTIADLAGVAIEHVGVDGCGVPVHALSLRGLATAFARLGARATDGEEGPAALVAALRAHPVMIAGTGLLDTVLLEATGGRGGERRGGQPRHQPGPGGEGPGRRAARPRTCPGRRAARSGLAGRARAGGGPDRRYQPSPRWRGAGRRCTPRRLGAARRLIVECAAVPYRSAAHPLPELGCLQKLIERATLIALVVPREEDHAQGDRAAPPRGGSP